MASLALAPGLLRGFHMRMRRLTSVVLAGLLAACGGGGQADDDDEPIDAAIDTPVAIDAMPIDAPPPIDAPMARDVRCGDPIPEGSILPPPPPTYAGTCPTLVPGRNTILSGGAMREFVLVLPTDHAPGNQYPLFFFWHELGGAPDSIVRNGQVQESADALQFIAVVPEGKGDQTITLPFLDPIDFVWPYLTTATDARVAEEVGFFDDLYACIAAQFTIDTSCLATAGVSAGGLWTSQLIQRRADRFASALIISGGVGPATSVPAFEIRGWNAANRALPVLVGWGGTGDMCGANFDRASHNLETGLAAGGHFVLECIHNCGHGVPPVDPTTGLAALYQFALDHPYWLRPGESPYQVRGLTAGTPAWCAMGVGAATPRTGACDAPVCPIPSL